MKKNPHLMQALHTAIIENQHDRVCGLLPRCVTGYKNTTEQGNNLLHLCVALGRQHIASTILNKLFQRTNHSRSTLDRSLTDFKLIRYLLLTLNNMGLSVLHIAAMRGYVNIFGHIFDTSRDLVLIGQIISHTDRQGQTVLHHLINQLSSSSYPLMLTDHIRIIHCIFCVINKDQIENRILLWHLDAYRSRNRLIMDRLLRETLGLSFSDIDALLSDTVEDEDENVVQSIQQCLISALLIENKAGDSPMHVAAQAKHIEIFYALIDLLSKDQLIAMVRQKNAHGESVLITIHRHHPAATVDAVQYINRQIIRQKSCCAVPTSYYFEALGALKSHLYEHDPLTLNSLNESMLSFGGNIKHIRSQPAFENFLDNLVDAIHSHEIEPRILSLFDDQIQESLQTQQSSHAAGFK